ncbi:MAG: PQQ-binding-like beta-propeller repeat protein [Verrucomicrobiia bacterium]
MNNEKTNGQTQSACAVSNPQQVRQKIGLNLASIAGIFCALVVGLMFVSHIYFKANDPLNSKEITQLKQRLVESPNDESLKVQIRKLDLELRATRERHIRFVKIGKELLIIGGIVFVASIQFAFWKRRLCVIKNKNKTETRESEFYRSAGAISLVAVCLGTAGFVIAKSSKTELPSSLDAMKKTAVAATENLPSKEEFIRQWPRFRGPFGDGITVYTNLPVKWDVESGLNIIWKTVAPSNGFNSPIVWKDKLFLSDGTAQKRYVFCYNADDGRLLWQTAIENVPGAPQKAPEVPDYTGYAAATMATDGIRVFAIFATYELVALDFNGKIVWSKYLGETKNPHGHAASLVTYKNMLLVQLDQGEVEDKLSKLYAFDTATGKVIWQKPRPVSSSWSTPLVFEHQGSNQILTLSVPFAISYSVDDGNELWRYEGLGGEVTSSPIYSNGKVFIISPADKLIAIDPQGRRDLTKSVLWTFDENIPDITSPTATKDFIFSITTMGILTCVNVADGKKLWEHDYGTDFHASPTLVDNRLYLISQKGEVFIVKASNKYEEIAMFKMDDKFHASPAVVNDRFYLRGEKYLYCIGNKTTMAAK